MKSCMMIGDEGYCLIQYFKQVKDHSGDNICNEKGFPQLRKTSKLLMTSSSSIITAVSIIHDCSSTCHYSSERPKISLERENVSSTLPISYIHDYSNSQYCLNTQSLFIRSSLLWSSYFIFDIGLSQLLYVLPTLLH